VDIQRTGTSKDDDERQSRDLNSLNYGKIVHIFLKGQAKEQYIQLQKRYDKRSRSILRKIDSIKEILKKNPQYGSPIPHRLIPAEFKKLGITNIYRIELPAYWRMFYTIEGNVIEIFIFVLFIGDHKEYDKLMKY